MTTRERAGLIGVLAAALLLRILLVLSLRGQPYFETPIVDSAAYDQWAQEIAGKSFWGERAFYQDPLYPYALGVFYKLFGRDLLAVRLLQTAIGTFGLWMLFEASRRLLGYRTAIVALAMGAGYQTFCFYDATLLKEFLGPVAIEAAMLAWTCDRKWKWLAFGAALGLGTLVRGNLLLVSVAVAAYLAIRREFRPAGLVLAGSALCILPVTIRNAVVARDFVITTSQSGPNLYTGNNPENLTGRYRPPSFLSAGAPEFEEKGFREEAERIHGRPMKPSEIDAYWRRRAVEYILGNPGTFVVVTFKRLLMYLSAFEIPDNYNIPFMARFSWVLRLPLFTFGLFLAPLAAAGLYLGWPERRKFDVLYVMLGAYTASILFFFMFGRYRLPIVPILLVFAAHAIVRTFQLRDWGMSALPKTAAAVFLVALIGVNVPLPASIGGYRDFRTAHYNLGIYYASHDQPARAAEEFESAVRLNPELRKDPSLVWALGQAYEKSGEMPRALENYREAVRMDPHSAEAAYRTGLIYYQEGMHERAVELLSEALRRDPGFAAAGVPLAESYRALRKPDAALDSLAALIEKAPKDWSLRLERARIYRDLAMWKETLRAAEETLEIRPGEREAQALRDEARRRIK